MVDTRLAIRIAHRLSGSQITEVHPNCNLLQYLYAHLATSPTAELTGQKLLGSFQFPQKQPLTWATISLRAHYLAQKIQKQPTNTKEPHETHQTHNCSTTVVLLEVICGDLGSVGNNTMALRPASQAGEGVELSCPAP